MINIYELINEGCGDIQLKITANDLLAFANHIIASYQNTSTTAEVEDESMTRNDVMEYLGIKPTTLHNWGKRGILRPTKIGRKAYYRKSDVLALQRGEVQV